MDTVTDDDVTCSWSLFSDGEDGTFTDADKAVAHFTPETDGDGVPDGWTAASFQAHRLFNEEDGDRTVTVCLDEAVPANSHAVLKIGDLPILLCEPQSWTLHIPTGTVWNVELKTKGAPVSLAVDASAGIFVSNDNGVFSSCTMAEDRPPLRAGAFGSPGTARSGSYGGKARIYCPNLILTPSMQVIHHGDSADVRVRFYPEFTNWNSRIEWSYDPPYMSGRCEVSDDGMSLRVSSLDDEWHSWVTVHARAGNLSPLLSTSATVEFCPGYGSPETGIEVSPEYTNVTIEVTYPTCGHRYDTENPEDTPFSFEVEAGRETANGWQRLARIDTDPATPGLQVSSVVPAGGMTTLSWDMKATQGQPRSAGSRLGADSYI